MSGKKIKITVYCWYCGNEASLVTGKEIYPNRPDLWYRKFYQCKPCDAYVGVHQRTGGPLGRLANAELRKAKVDAHKTFDRVWKEQLMSRSKAYSWLSDKMNLLKADCHIGMFDVTQCKQVQAYATEFLKEHSSAN